jgi:hypothetical protein
MGSHVNLWLVGRHQGVLHPLQPSHPRALRKSTISMQLQTCQQPLVGKKNIHYCALMRPLPHTPSFTHYKLCCFRKQIKLTATRTWYLIYKPFTMVVQWSLTLQRLWPFSSSSSSKATERPLHILLWHEAGLCVHQWFYKLLTLRGNQDVREQMSYMYEIGGHYTLWGVGRHGWHSLVLVDKVWKARGLDVLDNSQLPNGRQRGAHK